MGFKKLTQRHEEGITQLFKKQGIDHLRLTTTGDYLPALHRLFRARTRRRNG